MFFRNPRKLTDEERDAVGRLYPLALKVAGEVAARRDLPPGHTPHDYAVSITVNTVLYAVGKEGTPPARLTRKYLHRTIGRQVAREWRARREWVYKSDGVSLTTLAENGHEPEVPAVAGRIDPCEAADILAAHLDGDAREAILCAFKTVGDTPARELGRRLGCSQTSAYRKINDAVLTLTRKHREAEARGLSLLGEHECP